MSKLEKLILSNIQLNIATLDIIRLRMKLERYGEIEEDISMALERNEEMDKLLKSIFENEDEPE